MFIRNITIKNFRLFSSDEGFSIKDINIPDFTNEGTGLTVFVGENGCGKSTLLDALALPLLSYKADNVSIQDFYDPTKKIFINVYSEKSFTVDGTMPKGTFQSIGFSFEANIRTREKKIYLSSMVVSDQKYIKPKGSEKPKDGSPDLRVSINNPFKGPRFNENDILFLDKNRTYQTRSGTYNSTRFDRLLEDFDYQYIKKNKDIIDHSGKLDDIINDVENKFLKNAISAFEKISGSKIALNFIDNTRPFSKCFFAIKKENNQQILLNMIGSGYEMIFALLYSFYLSQQSGKQLIMLIDEPELHLHPSLQEKFINILLEFSKKAQIILCTHSPLFVKRLMYNKKVKINVLSKEQKIVKVLPVEQRMLSYLSSNEINYLAFRLPTEEYHNELYEKLKHLKGDKKKIKQFDKNYFQAQKGEKPNHPWKGHENEVSLHTFIRNQIHHQKNYGQANPKDLRNSIEKMRNFIEELVNDDVKDSGNNELDLLF